MKFLLAFLFAGLSLVSQGQKAWFSGDSTKFASELNGIFFNLPDNEKKIISPFMEDFVQKWNLAKFDPPQKKVIITMFNEMVKKKIRPYPDFFNSPKVLILLIFMCYFIFFFLLVS